MYKTRNVIAAVTASACLGVLGACGTDAGQSGSGSGSSEISLPDNPCGGPTGQGYMTCPNYQPPAPIPWGTGG